MHTHIHTQEQRPGSKQLRKHYSDTRGKGFGDWWECCLNYPNICFNSLFPVTLSFSWDHVGFGPGSSKGLFLETQAASIPVTQPPTIALHSTVEKRKRSVYYSLHYQQFREVITSLLFSLLCSNGQPHSLERKDYAGLIILKNVRHYFELKQM